MGGTELPSLITGFAVQKALKSKAFFFDKSFGNKFNLI